VLIVASGTTVVPEETEGLTRPGWTERVFTFYTLDGAAALAAALARFDRGRVVVNVVDMPIKCPVAPLELCFLADWYFRRRGVRNRVDLVYATPLDGAFTKPVAAAQLGGLLEANGIEVVTEFNTAAVDGKRASSLPTTTGSCPSTWAWSCRSTVGRTSSAAPPAWATR
jgi:sulfide:quinone oxidoreductase